MKKIIALVPARPGISPTEFRDYYESKHAPLLLELLPMMRGYVRNYPKLEGARLPAGERSLGFSAVTEVWFEDEAGYDRFLERLQDPQVRSLIRQDEANFCDSVGVVRFLVDESVSPTSN